MTPPQAISIGITRNPRRLAGFLLRLIRACVVLTLVCIAWVVLFLLFLPLILVAQVLKPKRETATGDEKDSLQLLTNRGASEAQDQPELVFDRRHDISKLFGCNTRNVRYRWSLFARRLDDLKRRFSQPVALDFGAGSLRDSYELAKQGFRVLAVDLDERVVKHYFKSYDWKDLPTPTLYAEPFETLVRQDNAESVHLAISFDVIEHLEDPADFLTALYPLLHREGLYFCIVPNGNTFFESYFRRTLAKQRKKQIKLTPGVPHLQFRSPEEWVAFFEAHRFQVIEHQMAIGPLVNDVFHAFLGLPIRLYVAPMFSYLSQPRHRLLEPSAFEGLSYPAWLMKRINAVDALFARPLKPWFGWNLIVAKKKL
jgi:2-polyprenyl-3-methyl-5-hydroxy-6-metoxy-1,4-benzoquinol methylase